MHEYITSHIFLPTCWDGYSLDYYYHTTHYHIQVWQQATESGDIDIMLDGVRQSDSALLLTDDQMEHNVEVLVPTPVGMQGILLKNDGSDLIR